MNSTRLKQSKSSEDRLLAVRSTDEIIDIMREEDEIADRKKILEAMTPACRKKLSYIETWLRKDMDHCLRSRYELGLQVQELYEDERKNNGKIYGKNAIGRICKLLNWEDGLLRWALRFVQAFTPEGLQRPCSSVLPGG